VFHVPVETIGSRFPDVGSGIPMPVMPEWSFVKMQEVLPAAFTIAFLAGIEALLSAVVADGMTGYKHRSNAELTGQGFANIASALFGGLPATGAIARTATNVKAGGRTPFAGIFHAAFLLLFMLFAMDYVAFIPMAALAAILFIVAWGMSEIRHFIHIFKLSASDRTVLLLTFFLTIFVDLTVAIGVGVTLACLLFMHQMTKAVEIAAQPRGAARPGVEEDETQRDDLPDGVEVFRLTGPVFFAVAGNLIDTLKAMGQMPKILILRMRLVPYLDATGATAIENLIALCHAKGTKVILSAVQLQPMKILRKGGVEDGADGVIVAISYAEAVNKAHEIMVGAVQKP
jgi:SulP family sulfate permease